MSQDDAIGALQREVETLTELLRTFAERENIRYTEILLKLNDLSDQKAARDAIQGGDYLDDELFDEARRAVIEAGKGSTSYLQRVLGVGYARAARLIDLLEEQGVIAPGDGAKPRLLLINEAEAEELEASSIAAKQTQDDALYPQVRAMVLKTRKASTSYLQRQFGLGYARAARMLDRLEEEGVVGPEDGAKPREVLVDL